MTGPLAAAELLDEDWSCISKNAGDIKATEVISINNLGPYRYIVNPKLGIKFIDNDFYQGTCKPLSANGSTISCEWDATRILLDPALSSFSLSDMSPSLGFVFGVVGSCAKI